MKAIIKGHKYQAAYVEGGYAIIQFVQKEERDGKFVLMHNGTTNEEVLAILIDRIMYLDQKIPDKHNLKVLENLISAKATLELRTKERKERGVEGTPKP